MLEEYTDEIKKLQLWHKRASEIVIKAESMDSISRGYIHPLNELRYCLDHFMRSLDYDEAGKDKGIDKERTRILIKKSIDSAIGHLQRTYSDSIEWILVSVKEEYVSTLKKYTNDQIKEVFPEYYTEIRPAIESITDVVNTYKINKSIEKTTLSIEPLSDDELKMLQNVTDQFLAEDIAEKLMNYLKMLHSREVSLIEIRKKDRKSAIIDKLLIPIITGIIGAVIAMLFQAYLGI